jgi:glycerophosphoryl diester phosphodiesterase
LLHDETLDRTTNGSGSVYRHSLAALRELDAGDGEKIPLLTEVLDLIDARVGLNIEIKERGMTGPLLELTNAYLMRNPRWRKRLMFSSFLPGVTIELGRVAPADYLIGGLCDDHAEKSLALAVGIGAFSLNISLSQLSQSIVQNAHANGVKVLVYTVNACADINRCLDASVDGIFTDFPARAIAFISNSPMIS